MRHVERRSGSTTTTTTRQYQDTHVDVKLVLSALWITMLFVFAVVGSAIGEEWVYYIAGRVVEVLIHAAIARSAWTWRPPRIESSPR